MTEHSNSTFGKYPSYEYAYNENGSLHMYYDYGNKSVVLADQYVDASGKVYYGLFEIEERLAPYRFIYATYSSIYATEQNTSGMCYIDPNKFNPDVPLSFIEYEGNNRYQDEDIAVSTVSIILAYFDYVLDAKFSAEYSSADLGFIDSSNGNQGSDKQPTFSVSPTSVSLKVGETKSIYVDVSHLSGAELVCKTENKYVATAAWGPEESSAPVWSIQITGVSAGETVISVRNSATQQVVSVNVIVVNGTTSTPGGGIPGLVAQNFPWHLYSNDGKTYLGKLTTNKYDSDGIWNEYGKYGSKYQSNSIWNEYGTYGSKYSSDSAFNEHTATPPIIVDSKGNVVGYLTANKYKSQGYSITQIHQFLLSHNQ